MSHRAWFTIESTDAGAAKAHLMFSVAGVEVWRPFDVRRDPTRGKGGKPRADIRTARFGRYFFIRCAMTDSLLEAIRRTTGVSSILCACGTDSPAVVPDGVIDWLRYAEREERTRTIDGPVKGDIVKVKEGPFASFEGRVTDLDKRGVVEVELMIFGRLTPAIFEVGHVEITKPAKSRAISSKKPNRSGRAA